MSLDPQLHLTDVSDEFQAVLDLFRRLTGREPTAAEVDEVRAALGVPPANAGTEPLRGEDP
jgi:hypothetical protein